MTAIANMSETEFTQLLDDYFAPPKERTKMTREETLKLASKLNQKVNIPLLNETGEEKILVKIVVKIDTFLYDSLPNEFYALIRDSEKGLNKEESEELIKRLSHLANKKINIPYLTETMEYFVIHFIIGIIVNAARKHWNFKIAYRHADKIKVSPPNQSKPVYEELMLDI